jgi:biotin carboxyl carrier protein
MEHEVRAARAGRIDGIGVRVGDQVMPGQRLVSYAGDGA